MISCNSNSTKDTSDENAAIDTVASVKLEVVTNAIKFPVQMSAAPDNSHRLFIGDLGGEIRVLKNGKILPQAFLDLSSKLETKDSTPEVKGMFGLAFHPQFSSNRKFYVAYNAPTDIDSNNCKLVISEFMVSAENPDSASLSSERRVLEVQGHGVDHDACNMAFGPDGYLYISLGDNHTPLNERKGQALGSLLGKMLRIDINKAPYGIPADNPFVGVKNARPEIWAYGLRRFWRFSFDPQTDVLIGGEVGDKEQEETNIIIKGGNYGWPIAEGDTIVVHNSSADTAHFVAPIDAYTHKDGICVIGGRFYYGKDIPFLKDKYVFADYNGTLYTLTKNETGAWSRQQVKISNKPTDPLLIISCDEDENNELYLSGVLNTKSGFKGVIYKIVKS
jgi:glucose/arabinose dehydrogenase